ncbi:MAG: oligosaccharide flippase family protein [Bacteroidaceae bacterium]|nr:oligosaccharide flippase family protein [Bacteroidaceae bacterium]
MSKSKRQVLVLYAATFVGAILNFVASKINTDVLDTVSYGNVRYVMNIVQLLSWVVLFGWFMSGSRLLALSDDPKRSARIRGMLICYLGIAAALLTAGTAVAGLLHGTELRTLFLCALPVCFYPLLTNYMNTTAQGDNHIFRLALARVLPVLCFIPVALLVYRRVDVVDSRTVLWLHWGICSAVLVAIVISTCPSFRNLKPLFADLRQENRDYGIHLYYGSLAMVATNYLSGVTLGIFDDNNANVGFFTLALSLAQPISYLPGIVGTTFFKRFVHEPCIPRRVMWLTLAITMLSCLGFILLIGPVVSLYDASYHVVARYAAWLAVGFSLHGVGDMINRYLGSHGQGRSIRDSSFACGAVKILGSFLLVWLWSVKGAILTAVLSSAVYTLTLYLNYRRFVNNQMVKS